MPDAAPVTTMGSERGSSRSVMRESTGPWKAAEDHHTSGHGHYDPNAKKRSTEYYRKKTLGRRRVFKWLPLMFENDLVHGSWWFVWASLFSMFIPVPVVVNLYLGHHDQYFHVSYENLMFLEDHAAVFILLAGCGVFFTVGSYLLVRAFREPALKPLIPCMLCQTDEVVASWCYFLGIVPTVPICIIYIHYLPDQLMFFGTATVVCAAASLVMLLFTFAVYPRSDGKPPSDVVMPWIHKCCCGVGSSLHVHFQNDWLLICWLFVIGSLFATVASAAALFWYCFLHNDHEIYNYATGVVDMLMITIGCMYYVAGSYPSDFVPDDEEVEDDEDDDEESSHSSSPRHASPQPTSLRRMSISSSVSSRQGLGSPKPTTAGGTKTGAMARTIKPTTPTPRQATSTNATNTNTPTHANAAAKPSPGGTPVASEEGSALSALRAKRNSVRVKGPTSLWQEDVVTKTMGGSVLGAGGTTAGGAARGTGTGTGTGASTGGDDDDDDDEWVPEGSVGGKIAMAAVAAKKVPVPAPAPVMATIGDDVDGEDVDMDKAKHTGADIDQIHEGEGQSEDDDEEEDVEIERIGSTKPPRPLSTSNSSVSSASHAEAEFAATFASLPTSFTGSLDPTVPAASRGAVDVDASSEDSYGIQRQQIPLLGSERPAATAATTPAAATPAPAFSPSFVATFPHTHTHTVPPTSSAASDPRKQPFSDPNSAFEPPTGSPTLKDPTHPSATPWMVPAPRKPLSLPSSSQHTPHSSSTITASRLAALAASAPENPFAPDDPTPPLHPQARSSSPAGSVASVKSYGSHSSVRMGPKPPNPFA